MFTFSVRLSKGMKGGGMKHSVNYYVTVIAVNKVGLQTSSYSSPVLIDRTPPVVRGYHSSILLNSYVLKSYLRSGK